MLAPQLFFGVGATTEVLGQVIYDLLELIIGGRGAALRHSLHGTCPLVSRLPMRGDQIDRVAAVTDPLHQFPALAVRQRTPSAGEWR